MNQLLSGFTKIEKSLQILAVVGVLLLLGYLGVEKYSSNRAPAPVTSPITQQ